MKNSNVTRRLKPALVAALVVGSAFTMISVEARGQYAADSRPDNVISWLSFMPAGCDTSGCLSNYRMRDGDVISVKIENDVVRSDQLEIVFRSGLNVSWWKELAIAEATPDAKAPYGTIHSFSTEGEEHGPKNFILRLNVAERIMLVFSKAKTFGVHTEMYRFYPNLVRIPRDQWPHDISKMGGARLTFVWEKD